MKIILPIILSLIIIFFLILIINHKYYFSEDFVGSYDQNTIEDIIPILYEPSNPYLKEELSEYEIIDIYKRILDRPPNMEELKMKMFLSRDDLTEELYNSHEYYKLTSVQNNLAEGGIESSIAKRNLLRKIISLYKNKYQKEPDDKILMPLRDCYIHLRTNKFLFKAFLESEKYLTFENDVLTSKTITKKILLEIFNKHYNLLELKIKAEEIIKNSKGGIIDKSKDDLDVEALKKELSKITKEPIPVINKETSPNISNTNEINKYLNEKFNTDDKSKLITNEINKNLKEQLNTDEEKNNLKEQFNTTDNGDLSSTIRRYIDNAIASNPNLKFLTEETKSKKEEEKPNEIKKEEEKPNEIRKITNELPENSELYVRIYNPIDYKQKSYTGDARFRPPICTSLGQKILEQPIYMNSSIIKGEDIDTVFNQTQVGSIMPKFIYKEYQDVRIR
jgi:hypothetical protein